MCFPVSGIKCYSNLTAFLLGRRGAPDKVAFREVVFAERKPTHDSPLKSNIVWKGTRRRATFPSYPVDSLQSLSFVDLFQCPSASHDCLCSTILRHWPSFICYWISCMSGWRGRRIMHFLSFLRLIHSNAVLSCCFCFYRTDRRFPDDCKVEFVFSATGNFVSGLLMPVRYFTINMSLLGLFAVIIISQSHKGALFVSLGSH